MIVVKMTLQKWKLIKMTIVMRLKQHEYPMKLQNSDVLANSDGKLGHLSDNVQCELEQLIHEREDIFLPMSLVGPMLVIMTSKPTEKSTPQ